ncbi:MAG: class B sortase [Peptoniphilus sp.]|nr:class B sortase [Peptoniphilus sp.]MDY3118398.1 class B sortase [Peptoniphilus sp.]
MIDVLMLACVVVLSFSVYKIVKQKISEKNDQKRFEILREEVRGGEGNFPERERSRTSSAEGPGDETVEEEEKNVYEKIYERNHDFAGWLKIDGTPIDYPVMCTPEDPNFYLRRNMEKQYSVDGTPFIGGGVSCDSDSFIIYAHQMNSGEMFGSLEKYKDVKYKNEHKYLSFYTLEEDRKYEVMTAFYTEIDVNDPASFRYYEYCGNFSAEEMDKFLEELYRVALYGKREEILKEDKILMLSTCNKFAEEGRFVVVAKRVENGHGVRE